MQLLQRLRAVHNIDQLRQLLKDLHTEGWMAATAPLLRAERQPQQAQHQSRASFPGLAWSKQKWRAAISFQQQGGRIKPLVFAHEDAALAGAARDVAQYWRTDILQQACGGKTQPALLGDR